MMTLNPAVPPVALLGCLLFGHVGPTPEARPLESGLSATTVVHLQQARLLRARDVDTMAVRTPGLRIAYGTDSLHFGDLRLPAGRNRAPVVVVVHGGCWFSPYASVRNTSPIAQAITDAGYATWNIEYRRYDHPGGGWPGTFLDVARAVDYVRVLARLHPIDSSRVIAIGHSAGAHLALWNASRNTLPRNSALFASEPIALRGVVSIGGITDLREFYARQLETCGNPGVESLLGGTPDSVPDRIRETSPIERLPLGIPTIHVAGARDMIAPESSSSAYANAARALKDSVEIVRIPGEGHFEAIAPGRATADAVVNAVRRLLPLDN